VRKLLRDALIELIEERSFDAITVGELAERAMMSRAAFYRYYQDKYDLVEQIFEETMQTFINDLGFPPRNASGDFDMSRVSEFWVKFFEHFAEYERLYRVLLGGKGSSWFAMKMRAYLNETIKKRMDMFKTYSGTKIAIGREEFLTALLAALIIDVVTWWLEQERPYTPQQLATYCQSMISSIVRDASTWDE
jgi:AcrR family transcriptional regulator